MGIGILRDTSKDYPIYSRKKEELTAAEEILFDCNKMAQGLDYFQIGGISVSPDNPRLHLVLIPFPEGNTPLRSKTSKWRNNGNQYKKYHRCQCLGIR